MFTASGCRRADRRERTPARIAAAGRELDNSGGFSPLDCSQPMRGQRAINMYRFNLSSEEADCLRETVSGDKFIAEIIQSKGADSGGNLVL
jgi:hypothetical protein